MGAEEPFRYDPVRDDFTRPYANFDPKAVSRASLTPKPLKPKQEGPLVSFNQHPDSWFIPASANTGIKPMKPGVKKWIKGTRTVQLILRCFELLCATGLLVLMIMIKNVYFSTLWIMRIVPGVAVFHTLYGVYHLSRKASGRTPGSSASYMFFASFFDLSFVPFYALGAYWSNAEDWGWTTVFSEPHITDIFTTAVFYCAAVGSGLFLISFGLSAYLALVFRKITNLPPDMNPLEDNLTSRASRHKRNKSSMSTATTISEKRISAPLESNRSSATVHDDFANLPTISFLQTRAGSTESFSTYKTTPPPSRDARLDLPSRQYQIKVNSARPSMVDLKRSSYGASSPLKRASYTEIPISDTGSEDAPRQFGMIEEAWFTAKSLNSKQGRASSPEKGTYQPIEQPYDSENWTLGHPNPLEANPPTPRHSVLLNRDSPLAEISNNRGSGDIADMSSPIHEMPSIRDFKAKHYGELRAATPPVLVGANRQVSSGADYPNLGGFRSKNRDVSGKVVEEGRGGEKGGWGARFRNISGLK